MQVLTGADMREADRRAIEEIGVPGRVLMESAGRAVAGAMEAHVADLSSRSIVILCGKGNNGGDGLVLLRTLTNLGYDARAIILAPLDELTPDSLANLQSSLKLGHVMDWVQTEEEWQDIEPHWAQAGVIVDAVLGTGLSSPLRGMAERVVDAVNALTSYRVAIDLPSGLSASTGAVLGTTFSADLTVALQAPKVCHYVSPACEYCGIVEVADIGIAPPLLDVHGPKLETIELDTLRDAWPHRAASSHKGTFGHVLIVAGSSGKTGAAVLAAKAALRAGAGLVSVASAASAIPVMATQVPEVMWEPLPETDNGSLALSALDRLLELASERSALVIGPGLGLHPETVELAARLIAETTLPTVADADALRAFSLKGHAPTRSKLGLTPHPGEAAKLVEMTSGDIQTDRLGAVRRVADAFSAHVVLKGFRTLVSDPSGNVRINLTGNPGLATAGSGDVLSGILGALLAQNASMDRALELGVLVHGLAGDLASDTHGQVSMTAGDVIAKLPDGIRALSLG